MHPIKFRFPKLFRVSLLLFFVGGFPMESMAEIPEPVFDFDGNPVTLQKAIDLTLEHNPVLNASRWERRSMDGRVIQAGLLPNPEIEAETENFAGSGVFHGFNAAETKVQLSQLIELGGKRAKRSTYAALGRDLAQWDYEVILADVVARATLAFMNVLFTQERLTLMRKLLNLANEVLQTTSERVKAGKISPMEKIKAEVDRSASRIDVKHAQFDLKVARRKLSGAWGGTTPTFSEARGRLGNLLPVPSLEALQGMVSRNPDVGRWAVAIEQHRAGVDLEQARGIPDLTVSLGAKHHNEVNDTAFVMGVSIPIPIFDTNQGATLEARDRLSKSKEESRAVWLRVVNNLAETYQRLSRAHMEATDLAEHVLPGAEAAFKASEEGFRHGKFDYLDMLDAQRTLVSMNLRYINALFSYQQARTRVERLIGLDMGVLVSAVENSKKGVAP
ncbi:MAG: TolC family protein [Deltaproteobacteria bacterium]|nr:TolC family protein [Deltaproteobacteria bacterium]